MNKNIKFEWKIFDKLSNSDLYAILHLRQEVFVVEQNCPYLDADNSDQNAFHLLGYESKKLVAVLGQRDRSINKIRGFGKFIIRLLAWSLDVKTGVDLNCGLRVFRREIILRYLYYQINTAQA